MPVGLGISFGPRGRSGRSSTGAGGGGFTPQATDKIAYNMSMMEFRPVGAATNTLVPTQAEIQHFADRNMKIMRLPIRWSYWQPDLTGGLDETIYGPKVMTALDNAAATGTKVILDMHEYGYSGTYNGSVIPGNYRAGLNPIITKEAFANFWSLVTAKVKDHPAIWMYDLYNEPENYGEPWYRYNSDGTRGTPYYEPGNPELLGIVPQLFDAATTAIRALDSDTIILRGGNHYSGAWDADIVRPGGFTHNDPVDRTLFACHCYPDRDSSGTRAVYATETSVEGQAPPGVTVGPNIFEQRIGVFYNQLIINNCRPVDGIFGVVGEIGLPNTDDWEAVVTNGLDYCMSHGLLPVIWTAGRTYQSNGYPFSIHPKPNGLQSAQMSLISPRVGAPEPTVVEVKGPARAVSGQPTSSYTVTYRGNNLTPRAITITDTAGWTWPTGLFLPAGRNPTIQFTGIATNNQINQVTIAVAGFTNIFDFTVPNVDAQPVPGTGALMTSAAYDPYAGISKMPSVHSVYHLEVSTYPGPIVQLTNASGETRDFYPTLKIGDFYVVDQEEIASWAGGVTAPIKINKRYDQSGAGLHFNYESGREAGYILAGRNNFPYVNHTGSSRSTMSANFSATFGGQTLMKRTWYTSGTYVFASTSNTNGTIGVRGSGYAVHTGADYDRNTNLGVTSLNAPFATDTYHNYAFRARVDTVNGLQAWRDGTLVAQADLTGGAITWDRDFIYEHVRPGFGVGSPVEKVQHTLYVPAPLTDAEITAILAQWDALAAIVGPVIVGPAFVPDPVDEPLPAPSTSWTAPTYINGVNISGGETTMSRTASYGSDYSYGDQAEYEYWSSKGFTAIRLPLRHFRFVSQNFKVLNATEIGRLKTAVDRILNYGMYVILDPHDYGWISDTSRTTLNDISIAATPLGHDLFVDFWRRMASKFKNYPNVIFGLMNEPVATGTTAANWRDAAIDAYNAIRSVGANQLVLIPGGTNYTAAQSWATAQNTLWDTWLATNPTNFAFEVHQYFDSGNTGGTTTVVAGKANTELTKMTNWLRDRPGVKAFLGEFGWSGNDSQASGGVPSVEGTAAVSHLYNNRDVWKGWTYWKGGWWKQSQGPFGIANRFANYYTPGALDPDKPQVAILQSYFQIP